MDIHTRHFSTALHRVSRNETLCSAVEASPRLELVADGKTLLGTLLAVTLFVAAGFQHAPANMRYFSLAAAGGGPDPGAAVMWNLIPAGIGNVIGGTFLVDLPFWVLHGRDTQAATVI